MDVEGKVMEIISRASGLAVKELKPDAKLADLNMESLEKLECVLSLEDALQVEIKENDLWRLKTVQDIVDSVRRSMPSPA
jgi:acyl carrier protein